MPWRPSRIAAVGEDPLDEREDAARSPQQRSATIAILDARRMQLEHEAAAVRVDQSMALASVDLLSSIVTAWPAGLGGLDALASLSRRMMSSASFANRLYAPFDRSAAQIAAFA